MNPKVACLASRCIRRAVVDTSSLFLVLALLAPSTVNAQTGGASLTPGATLVTATIANSDPNFTVAFTYTTTWESQKVTPQGLQPGPLLTSSPQVAHVGPGKSTVAFA